jgi:cell division protein FtsZ
VTTISSIIQEAAGDEAEIIFGAVHDSNMKEEVRVTVIATGFEKEEFERSDNVIRPDFRSSRSVPEPRSQPAPLYGGTRQVMPSTPMAPAPVAEQTSSNGRDGAGSTPVHKFPTPRPAPDPRMPSDLEIPTFIRRQMD